MGLYGLIEKWQATSDHPIQHRSVGLERAELPSLLARLLTSHFRFPLCLSSPTAGGPRIAGGAASARSAGELHVRRAHGSCLQLRGSEQTRRSSAETKRRAPASPSHPPASRSSRARCREGVSRCPSRTLGPTSSWRKFCPSRFSHLPTKIFPRARVKRRQLFVLRLAVCDGGGSFVGHVSRSIGGWG